MVPEIQTVKPLISSHGDVFDVIFYLAKAR